MEVPILMTTVIISHVLLLYVRPNLSENILPDQFQAIPKDTTIAGTWDHISYSFTAGFIHLFVLEPAGQRGNFNACMTFSKSLHLPQQNQTW